ncbi:COP9 signalosome complex subunit 7 [Aspergillus cristatus]|uniref:COP9 signalosome complex subunit 7 n=1 Tax=Aspergillus cristatus TaxID=573508 RepID=A0A1E3BP74_ASPCR|nr:COP9 signalosome complex subunit 7 [Aspergillus cristatus]
MDHTHARALEALQPFIHLANSNSATSPRFIAKIITDATSSPQAYVFAELLESRTIQSLRSKETPEEYQGYLTLLEIFAWGTWKDYQSTPNLPKLNQDQTLKLRLLSLLSLAPTIKPLTYEALMEALSISTPAELESLVTKAIYSSLITARLSPASDPPTVNVTSVAPLRDVKPQSLPSMISILTEWESRCGGVISDIEAEIEKIKANSAKRAAKENARAELLNKAINSWSEEGDEGHSKRSGMQSGGRRLGPGGGGNKREYSADDNDDDGYFENGSDDAGPVGSRMDIDEGVGTSRVAARQAKRLLGKKT